MDSKKRSYLRRKFRRYETLSNFRKFVIYFDAPLSLDVITTRSVIHVLNYIEIFGENPVKVGVIFHGFGKDKVIYDNTPEYDDLPF